MQSLKLYSEKERLVPKIEKVSLFGSRARGSFQNYSDIDLVLYGDIEEKTVDLLWTAFYESYLPYTVDLKVYQDISYTPLKEHIERYGKTLFTKKDLYD